MSFDSIVNRGDYFSAHYLAEVLPKDLKKKDGLLARWTEDEKTGRTTPRRGLRALSKPYFADRPLFADVDVRLREGELVGADDRAEWRKELNELHGDVLRALGFTAQPRELVVERAGREYAVQVAYADQHLVAVECGWAAGVDAALDDDRAAGCSPRSSSTVASRSSPAPSWHPGCWRATPRRATCCSWLAVWSSSPTGPPGARAATWRSVLMWRWAATTRPSWRSSPRCSVPTRCCPPRRAAPSLWPSCSPTPVTTRSASPPSSVRDCRNPSN
ncbi:hypothetical protein ACFQX6_55250 [Streptosporangium lutulentum]